MEYKKKGRAGVIAANRLMKEQKRGIFAPGVRERGAKLGGLAVKQKGVGIFAPGMQAKGWRAAGLDKIWDDPVFREMARWRRSPWKARRGTVV